MAFESRRWRLAAPALALAALLGLAAGCEEGDVQEAPPAKEKAAEAPAGPSIAAAPGGKAARPGSSATPAAPAADARSLYERLGGEPAITAVIDDFTSRLVADPRIGKRFEGVNLPRLRRMLVEQVCAASGGPQKYTGRDMRTTHAGMGVTDAEFDALVGDLVGALDKLKVGEREKGELLGALGPMRADVVERPPTAEERLMRAESRIVRLERAIETLLARIDALDAKIAAAPTGAPVHAGGCGPAAAGAAAGKTPPRPPVASGTSASAAAAAKAPDRGGETPPRTPPAEGSPRFAGFTEEEKKLAASLVERYANAAATQGEARGDLMNAPLEHTKFFSSTGDEYDLRQFVGKKRVVLVIMRGFAGTVCINCSTQTLSLADKYDEFKARNAEVVLVYPGEIETVATFLDAVRSLREGFAPPFPVVLDVDLAAVRTFMIQGSLAKPTSLVIDERGIVRYAYVGKQPADRPSAKDLLKVLDAMPRRAN